MLTAGSDSSRRSAALITDTVVYGTGEVLGRMLGVLLLPVFTAYLSPPEYGVVSLLTALGLFLVPVFSLGFGAGIAPVYFEGNSPERKTRTIATTLAILLISAAALTVLATMFANAGSRRLFGTAAHARLVWLTGVGCAFTILTIPLRQRLQFERRSRLFVALSLVTLLSTATLTIVGVVALRRGAAGMVEATCLGQLIGLAAFGIAVVPGLPLRMERTLATELLAISVPLVPAFAAVFVLQHGPKYVLQWQRGLDEVGRYAVGANLGMAIAVAINAFQTAWLPYFMGFVEDRRAASLHFGRLLTYFVLAFGGISLLLFAVAPVLVRLMASPAYFDAWQVVGLSAVSQMLSGVFLILLPGVYFAKAVPTVALTQSAAAIVSVALTVLLVRPLGVPGAAVAQVTGYGALVMFQYAFNRYRGYLAIPVETRRLARFAVLFVAVAALSFWSPNRGAKLTVLWPLALAFVVPPMIYLQLSTGERGRLWRLLGSPLRAQRHASGEA